MKRRDFTLGALGGAGLLAASLPGVVAAQGGPVEGKDYVKLNQPVTVPGGGKVDVVEFFWYGCPHCNTFEPMLDGWIKKLPADVAFRRAHVSFTAQHETHAKIFYALEASGQFDALHRKVFAEIHQQRKRLDKEAEIVAFVAAAGGDAAKFSDAFNSFGVATKVRQGKQLSDAYKIDGVPAIGVAGRWFTSPSMAGGYDKVLVVTESLIQRARKS